MGIAQPVPGVAVCVVGSGDSPDEIALVESADAGEYLLRFQDGGTQTFAQVRCFPLHKATSAKLAFAALAMVRAGACEERILNAVGSSQDLLRFRSEAIAQAFLIEAVRSPERAAGALGPHLRNIMDLAAVEARIPEGSDLGLAAARFAEDTARLMPDCVDDPKADHSWALLADGVLPKRAERHFYCGAYDVDTGELVQVRTWGETRGLQLHHGEYFSRRVAARIDSGLLGYVFAHQSGNAYSQFRLTEGRLAPGAIATLAEQFTIDGKRPQILVEVRSRPGQCTKYQRRDNERMPQAVAARPAAVGMRA